MSLKQGNRCMPVHERLTNHIKNRLVDLLREKESGKKIIGYTPGGYFPEELVLACGAIPLCLARGGDHSALDGAAACICRWIDTFCRAQIGYGVSGDDPYYKIIDLLVVPVTDNHMRAISDILACYTDLTIFNFGVPHMKEKSALEYFQHGITRLKKKLEELTGVDISDTSLREAISLCNRERELLREISLLRRSNQLVCRSRDFIDLCHGSLIADKHCMLEMLESFVEEMKGQTGQPLKGPRILLTGSTLAIGDYRVIDLLETAGGAIVIEDFAEGINPYWMRVSCNGNLMQSLAESYFMQRVPPAWFRPGKERLDFLITLARDFKVDAVIWYQLMYRESYKTESYYFPARLKKELGIPMLTLESDYGPSETEPLRTRIEAFVETLRR